MTYRVIDTDTYQDEQTGEKFRLAGANAPEKHTPEGQMALSNPEFQNRLNQTEVTRLGRDHYGRTVARFTSPDGTDFGQEQISAGLVGPVDYTGGGQMYASPLARPDEYTPEQKALAGESPTPQGYSYSPPPKEKSNLQKLGAGVGRGWDTAKAGYFGAQSAAGNLIARDPDGAGPKTDTLAEDPKTLSLRDRFSNWMQRTGERGYMRNMQQAEQNPKTMTFQQATESGKLADYSSFAFEAMGEAIPSIIEMLGVGAATAVTAGGAGLAVGASTLARAAGSRALARQLIASTRKKLIAQGMTPLQAQALSKGVITNLPKHLAQVSARRGFTAGMFGSSAGMQTGQFYKEAENETGVRAPGTALLAGAAAGALDVVGFEVFLSQLLNKRIPINKALDILKPVMAGVAMGVPSEGLTEAAQEVIGVLNTEYHRKSDIPLQERMMTKENLWRYAEAGAAGAVFGGAFGGAGGVARGTYDFATRERPPVDAPAATPPAQETPTVEPGTPAATGTPLDLSAREELSDQQLNELIPDAPAEPEGLPDFDSTASPEGLPDFDSTASPEGLPDFDSTASPEGLPDFDSTASPEGLPDLTSPATPEGLPDFDSTASPEGLPDLTPPATPEGLPDLTPPATPEGLPDLTPPATPEGLPDFDASAGQNPRQNLDVDPEPPPGQDVNLNPDSTPPTPPAAKPYTLNDQATPDQQRGFLFDSEEAAAQTARDLLGPLDIPVTPRQQHEVSIAEDNSVIPGSGAFGLATPGKRNNELTVGASEGVAQDVETVPARFLADMDKARTTLGGTPQLRAALTRASPNGWAKDEVVPKVLDTFETLSLAQFYADEQRLKSGEYLIGRKDDGYTVVDLRAYLKAQPGPTETGVPVAEQNQGVSASPAAAPAPRPKVAAPKTEARLFEKDRWGVEDVRNDPESVYIFGDNVVGKGNAGQAVIRGLPNAMGIPTKYAPSMAANAFFRDVGGSIAPVAKQAIDNAIAAIKATGKPVVFSKGGLGTGLAKLQEAPATLAYLNQAVKEAFGIDLAQAPPPAPSAAPSHDAGLSPLATEQAKVEPEAQRQVEAAKAPKTPLDSKRSTPTQGTTPEAAKPPLPQTGNPHRGKDQGKWAKANKFIGRGSKNSSTQKYANALGPLANSGQYEASDRVFVSAEGARTDRIEFDAAELQKALDAGAMIITDDATNRARDYNRGERAVATYLEAHGYQETKPGNGEWVPTPAPSAAPKTHTAPTNYVDGGTYDGEVHNLAKAVATLLPHKTAFAAVLAGLRTATTRNGSFAGVKKGDIIQIPHKDGPLLARATADAVPISSVNKEDWSKGEGWEPKLFDHYKGKKGWVWLRYAYDPALNTEKMNGFYERLTGLVAAAPTPAPSAAPSHDAGLSPKAESKRSTPTPGTTPEAFRQELSAKERKRLDASNVHVLHRTTDAPFKVAPDTAGLYLPDGSVYFFTENIAPGEAFGKTVHELGAHYGLQRMVGKEAYDGVLAELQRMANAEGFASVKAAHQRAKEAGASDEALWHETLAYLAEASPRHGLIRRLVHAIKRFLRSLGVPVGKLTETDLVSLVQVAAFKEGLKGEGLSGEMLASKRSPTTPYVAQYGVKTLKNGKVVSAYAILFDGGKPLALFSKKVEAEAALKADREGYAQKAKALYESGQKRVGQADANTAIIEPYQRRLPDGKIVQEWGIRRGSEWLGQGYATEAEAQPAFDYLTKRGSTTKDTREGVPAPNLEVDLRAQEKGKDLPVRQRPAPVRKDTPENLRTTPSMEGASPLYPEYEPALDVKPLTGKLGKLAAMMRGAKDKTRAISTSLALILRSERKAPGVNVSALLELYRNALDTGRTEQAEPEEVAERQNAAQKRVQKQRRAVALVTELRDAAQVVAAEEDQLAERVKDFNAAKQRATKDPAFIKELQQSAQEAEQRVNAAKAHVEALKTEEAALLKALKKPVARSVRNLTKRQQAAVAGLAQDHPDLTDRLRAVTAWVSPTDLPLIDHLAKVIEAIDDYRHRDTSTLYDLDDVLVGQANDFLDGRAAEALVFGEPGEGWNEQSMNVEAPTEGFYTLFKGQYFTQALADVLSPLLKSTKRTEGELRARWDQVTEALESVSPIERTLFALIEAANTMVPAQGATLDAATRVVEMKLSDAEAWLNEDPDTTFGTLLLREVQTEDAKLEDPAYAKRNAHSNVGRFTRALTGMQAWHDRYQVPYGQLYLQYDAKSQQFSITERMTSTNPNAMEVFVDPHTGIATSLLEWVNDYLAKQAKDWKLPGKTGKETEFFRDNVLALTPIDHITGKFTGKAQKADPLLKTDSQTGFIYVQGKSLTQLGYALAQQQGLMTPENDYRAFMLARAALLDHANLALNTPELMDKNIARSAKVKLTFAQALAQEQGAREGRLPKATDKLLEPNTLGVAPAPSVVEGEVAFKKSLNDMDLTKREVFDPVYQKVYDTQIAKGKSEALAQKIATGRANEALRKHLEKQKDKERASDAWEYEGQWDLDSGTAPLDVAEKKQLAAAEEDAAKNQRLSKVEERIGETAEQKSVQVNKDKNLEVGPRRPGVESSNLPVQVGGVFGQGGTEAHGLVKRALDALGFTKTRIHLYTSDQVDAYEAALKERNATVWQGFTTRRERVRQIPAAVAFIQGEIHLYYDKNLTGEALREVLSHELGHVVFRVMLNSERERNTPLWNRLFDEYQEADTGQRFMEWFADEAGKWINQRDQRVTNATQGFIKRIVDALKAMFRALGLRPAKGAVAAYMDGLALREKEQAYAEFRRALTGRIGQGYDLTTMQMAYHSRASERVHLGAGGGLDFITMDGVKQGTIAQAQRLLEAVPLLNSTWGGTKTVGQWFSDTLSTANNFLREQDLAELTMHADVLDRGARQRVIEFTTNEQIDELLHDPGWSELLGGVAEAKVQELKDRANALRRKGWVAGVVLVKYKDQRTDTLKAEIRPIPQESFNAAIHRLYQGQWGSSDEGYRKLLHGKTEAEVSEIGKELLRNDPKSETAKALAAWLKTFYKDYVVEGFKGAHSGTIHIGQQADWGLARYYSPKAVEANLQAFIDLLTTTRKDEQGEVTWRGMQEGEAREFATHIITGQEAITEKDLDEAAGLVRPTLSPGAPSKQGRNITLPIEELLPFLETNADAVVARYTHSMIKRVEWEKRFGDEVLMGKNWVWQPDLYGQLTQQALINNHRDTLSASRMKYLLEKTRAINEAYLGRYGAYTTDPRVRSGMSWIQAGMNLLVMPLSLLSQAPDLVGPLTRMGKVDPLGAYSKGMRDAYRAMRNKNSDLWKVAEMYGIVYRDFRDAQAASFFDSQYLTTGPQKVNDWLFKWNGMQMFTNFSRLLSFHASGYWLEDLVTGQHPDAERWLKDLGLTLPEVKEWVKDGKKEYTSADGEKSVAFKIMLARQRFVQESVFSPNAGQRPLFASHPYAMLVWHLKQFTFSFFTQILKPAYREVKKNPRLYGKMMAVLPLALMMPLALVGMGLRDWLKYNELVPWRGERPSFDQDPEGWLSEMGRIIGRTGVLGPLQLLIDADRQQSWGRSMTFALAGPAASKLEELMLADDTGEFVMKALPGLSMLPAERAAFRAWVE